MKRRTLLAAAPALLVACATSTPPPRPAASPARPFGPDEFFAVDPALLRAAVLTDPRAVFQAVELQITVQAGQQPARYVIRLQQPLALDPRLPPAPADRAWQVFSLTAEDAATLATVRQLLLSQPRGAGGVITIEVAARPALVPTGLMAAVPLRIDMLTDDRAGWFTAVEPTTLDTRPNPAQGRS